MSDHLTVSPYLCRPLDRSYRDFLEEQIARLEAEPRRLGSQLAMLREEWERIAERGKPRPRGRGPVARSAATGVWQDRNAGASADHRTEYTQMPIRSHGGIDGRR